MASGETIAKGYKRGVNPYEQYAHLLSGPNASLWSQCERCGDMWPESRLVWQDGRYICRDNCAWPLGKDKLDKENDAWERSAIAAEANTREPRNPMAPLMRGVPRINSESVPLGIRLYAGGDSVVVVFEGDYLSDEDVITFSGGSVTAVAVYAVGGQSVSVTFSSPALSARGDFDFYYNGDRYPNLFRVRSLEEIVFTLHNVVVIITAGTRVPATTSGATAILFVIQAESANVGNIYYGDVTVASTNGIALAPGESMLFPVKGSLYQIDDLWFDADTSGNKVRVVAI